MKSFVVFPNRMMRAAAAIVLAAFAFGGPAFAAGPKAYVGNFKDNSVSVIDTGTRAVLATLPVAAGPDGIVITPDGATAFVSGSSATSISVIDTATDKVASAIEVGKGPQGLAITPDGRWLLVAVNGEDRVAIVDIAGRSVAGSVAVAKPHTIAVRADGKLAYVTSQEPGHFALSIVDLATRAVVASVPVEKPPRDLEFGHDGRALYFTLAGVAAVQVLDPATNKVVAQIATGPSPHLAHHFAGMREGVVVVQGPGEVMLFDPATNAAVRSIAVGKQPHWIDASADGKRLFVSNEGSNTVSVVDPASGETSTIAVGNAPRKIAVQRLAKVSGAAGGAAHVAINNFVFEPAQITITAGQSVVWSNDDGAPHGVKFKDGTPGQELMLPGQTYTHAFAVAGTYDYACSVHPYMTARVTVRAR
jgi:YVTN family beta-propeller protein